MLPENILMKVSCSSDDLKLGKKKLKLSSKILILTILCGDVLLFTGFIAHRLYGRWVEANYKNIYPTEEVEENQVIYPTSIPSIKSEANHKNIYPTEVEKNQVISPTSIPWIKSEEECLRSNRVWEDDKCLDFEWSHLF